MVNKLSGKKVAVLVAGGFEQVELFEPRRTLQAAGAAVFVVSPERDVVRGWDRTEWGDRVHVDVPLEDATADDYDALLLPGGVMNPDRLRMNDAAVRFVGGFLSAGKPIAAICHAPALLIETGALRGRTLTSYPSLRTDLRNAGAEWVDEEVVTDEGLVTSRTPGDLPAFNRAMVEVFAAGVHARRRVA